jgi:AcrR family transcriptional regulator
MSTNRRSRAEMAQDTTHRLLAVARQAFAVRGFAEVSLDGIAAEAGLTRGALHHHFGNKAGLLEAVLRQMDDEIGAEIDAAWDPTLPSWAGWRACFHQYLNAVLQPDRLRLFFLEAPSALGARAWDILLNSGLSDIVEGLSDPEVAGAIIPGNAEALAHALNGAVVNLCFWIAADPTGARRDEAHRLLDQIFDGLTR